MRAAICTLTLVAILLPPLAASSRSTELDLSIQDALDSDRGRKLRDVRVYFAGQRHPEVRKELGVYGANRATRGVLRSDARACAIAFLSALFSLQERAQKEGGNAVIDIVSTTGDVEKASETEYRCLAGSTVVRVALSGKIVQL